MTIRKAITDNSEGDGIPIGVAFYHPGWNTYRRRGTCLTTRFHNGWVRWVFTDIDGRATMTGWFFREFRK